MARQKRTLQICHSFYSSKARPHKLWAPPQGRSRGLSLANSTQRKGVGAPTKARRSQRTVRSRLKRSELLRWSRGRRGGRSFRRRSWRLSAARCRSRSFPPRFPKHAIDQGGVVFAVVPLRLHHHQDGDDHNQDKKNPHSNTLPIPAGVTYTNVMKTKRAGARLAPGLFRTALGAKASQSAAL